MRLRWPLRRHDPERDAAAYLAGLGRPADRRRFEAHLVSCEECWKEVHLGRAGRAVAERARELAPPSLRDDVRAAVMMSEAGPGRRSRLVRSLVAVALAGAVAAALLATLLPGPGPAEPRAIAAVLASFRSNQIPVGQQPRHEAPDLSSAGVRLEQAGRGVLGGMAVDVFTFRSARGDALFLFLGDHAFPQATGAVERTETVHGWRADNGDVRMLCADRPASYLLVGRDAALLARAEAALRSQPIVTV